jgi:hypothetical protein
MIGEGAKMISQRLMATGTWLVLASLPLLSAPANAQIYFSDDFENPAQSQSNWEVITGDWQVADGVYHQSSTADPWLVSMVAADKWKNEWVEYTVEFDVKPLTTGDAPVNVLFRVQDPVPKVWADRNGPNTHLYRWIVNGWTNTESRPYIYDGGTATMLAQVPNSLDVGTWYHLMLVVTKTRIAGYVNDVQMFDVAHAKWTDGRVGIHAYSGKMDFDNLIVYGPDYLPPWRLKAKQPDPADGTVGLQLALFRWTGGELAAFHDVYLGTSPDLGPADLVGPHSVVPMYFHLAALQPGTQYYWRVDEIENDGVTIHPGDVWSFVTQDVKAYYPTPANGTCTASLSPTLAWRQGLGALEDHLYFGDSNEAVVQATADVDKGVVTETTFAPGSLEPLAAYFWRVDEMVAGGTVKTGPVWTFTTPLPVEDFESYTDQPGEEIFETWIDGYTNQLSGSIVGKLTAANGTYGETVIVHGGAQSMPMDYNNLKAPFYSEAEREFTPTQDWTVNGADALVLYVRGASGNQAAPLYATIEDSSGRAGTMVHPDPAITTTTQWSRWRIPLSGLAGVNLARVKKLALGVGNKNNPVAGGSGTIYVDDLQVTRP